MKDATISLYHDTRRILDDGNYPVKLRIYFNKAKLFETGKSLTKHEFAHAYNEPKPRARFKEIQTELKAIEARAAEIIKNLRTFSFDSFRRELYRNKSSVNNIIDHYSDYIKKLKKNEQEGTASSYECSINSIKSFVNNGRKNPITQISFDKVDTAFLEKYERWMIESGNSRTTVGIYLRPLRKIFNAAIETRDIAPELYPFKQYKIPTGKNTKKNLESDVLKSLYTADLRNDSHQEEARDFWFFSYQCNGMNFRDIAELKFKNFTDTYFSFLRHKTINTTKDDPTPIVVPITDHIRTFIKKYGVENDDPNDYVFPIFTNGMSALERHVANKNFIRYVNQHMKKLVKSKGITFKLGTMYARHSFTTRVTREIGLEFAQEALGHTSLATTQNYWAGFEQTTKRTMADKLLDFE